MGSCLIILNGHFRISDTVDQPGVFIKTFEILRGAMGISVLRRNVE